MIYLYQIKAFHVSVRGVAEKLITLSYLERYLKMLFYLVSLSSYLL